MTEHNLGDSNTRKIRFHFTIGHFLRWADGCAGGLNPPDMDKHYDPDMAFNDKNSWNFQITVTDSASNTNSTYDEFGVFKYQEMSASFSNPSLDAMPGSMQEQMETHHHDNVTVVSVRINAPFRLAVNITDLVGPEIMSAQNVYLEGGALSPVQNFPGPGYANRLYYQGSSASYVYLKSEPDGGLFNNQLTWYMDVPGGISEGQYKGYITYLSETSSNPVDGEMITDAIKITNIHELQAINDDLSAKYELANDIDASETLTWNGGLGFEPIGEYDYYGATTDGFTGVLDGKGYTVSSLYINRPGNTCVGLFGRIGAGGVVKNIDLTNIDITGGGDIGMPEGDVGGIAGLNDGTIRGSSVGGIIKGYVVTGGVVGWNRGADSIEDCHSFATVEGASDLTGGIAGYNNGRISACFVSGPVSGANYVGGLVGENNPTAIVENSHAAGEVSGNDYVGGFVGYNYQGQIINSHSWGKVNTGNIGGGFCAFNNNGQVTSCYWDVTTSQMGSSSGGTGKTTSEMMTQSTFGGWDFTNIWHIKEGVTYPRFSWQPLD
ncbi:MAG TPA: hypothetical protein ENN76_00910 [Euryarchaeota archaeon]|nr:hypothetical protein [Euryarchaeota archaeon]